jgi:hypothetical protein
MRAKRLRLAPAEQRHSWRAPRDALGPKWERPVPGAKRLGAGSGQRVERVRPSRRRIARPSAGLSRRSATAQIEVSPVARMRTLAPESRSRVIVSSRRARGGVEGERCPTETSAGRDKTRRRDSGSDPGTEARCVDRELARLDLHVFHRASAGSGRSRGGTRVRTHQRRPAAAAVTPRRKRPDGVDVFHVVVVRTRPGERRVPAASAHGRVLTSTPRSDPASSHHEPIPLSTRTSPHAIHRQQSARGEMPLHISCARGDALLPCPYSPR